MLYLSSRMEVCCSSWASVLSIWLTCDRVALICDWFGAGPGSVVEVVAPAFATAVVDSNAPSKPTDHGQPDKRSPPADSVPTIHCIHGATA